MKTLRTTALTSLMVMMAAGAVQAKPLSRILATSGFAPADFELMIQSEAVLYSVPAPQVGASESWKNQESGSYGSVKIAKREGGCLVMAHTAHVEARENESTLQRVFCKDDKGAWRLVAK